MRRAAALALLAATIASAAEPPRTENVVLAMLDGLRWEEVFFGAEESLISRERGGVPNVAAVRQRFWRDAEDARRRALMPFLWETVAKEGQLLGNGRKGCAVRVTNKL